MFFLLAFAAGCRCRQVRRAEPHPFRNEAPMNTVQTCRSVAFSKQGGLCHYCKKHMWLTHRSAFAKRHGLTNLQAAARRCTAEHLQPRAKGGKNDQSNVVAACWYCNQARNWFQNPPSDRFGKWARRLESCGQWYRPKEALNRFAAQGYSTVLARQ